MSFRINTNIAAMSALRHLNVVNMDLAKSIERLASGLRINSAGDDPIGLMMSESFRAQMAGIDQAISNSQNGVNMAKTAESALDEVSRLLRDARALALAATNGTLGEAERQANQTQLNSIAAAITRIAETTQFGSKNLLDGTAGVQASITSAANIAQMVFGGNFNGASLTTNSLVTVEVTTAATRATVTGSVTYANTTSTVPVGTFSINGHTFTVTSGTTVAEVVSMINAESDTTGVTASHTAGQGVVLTAAQYGTVGNFALSNANAIINAVGTVNATGVNALANVTLDTNGSAAGGLVTVDFVGGRYGESGLVLTDSSGNSMTLTSAGNVVAAAYTAGNLVVGSVQFQIGANADQTVGLSIRNFRADQLGRGVVSGLTLSNLDLTTVGGANNALDVIDAAIGEVTGARGDIGAFQKYTLESNIRSLGVAREQIAASESAIREVDVAEELTNLTRLQVLQKAGLAMLAQANAMNAAVLSLLA